MAAHSVDASGNFLVPNATFIAEFVAFLLILGILAKYVYPVIRKPIQARQALIAKQIEEAAAASKRFAEAEAEYQRALNEARAEAARSARTRGPRRRGSSRSCAPRRRKSRLGSSPGRRALANQRGAIVRELRGEIGSLAVELSEKIVNQRLADDAPVRPPSTPSWPISTPRCGRGGLRYRCAPQAARRWPPSAEDEATVTPLSASTRCPPKLYAFAGLLVGQPRLRRMLADPATDPAAGPAWRSAVGGKVSPAAPDIVPDRGRPSAGRRRGT